MNKKVKSLCTEAAIISAVLGFSILIAVTTASSISAQNVTGLENMTSGQAAAAGGVPKIPGIDEQHCIGCASDDIKQRTEPDDIKQ